MELQLTVSQLNRYVKLRLEEDKNLSDILILGEIGGLKDHYASGHLYFTLKDESSSVRAVMFKGNASRIRFRPEDGMRVLARCTVSLYERDGSFQVYVKEMLISGEGALYQEFLKLRERLSKEGLFSEDRKRPLPRYPQKIGVVTSESGAAIRDILNVISRRWPLCEVVVSPSAVQGIAAPMELTAALKRLEGEGCDVVIIGRGGGSAEDLAAFNDEALARAIFAHPAPVVSAVGHETDYSISDFVSDLRAPTPSAAAELVTPDREELLSYVSRALAELHSIESGRLDSMLERLDRAMLRISENLPERRAAACSERLLAAESGLYQSMERLVTVRSERLASLVGLLGSLSPTAVMSRGYSFLERDGRVVGSVNDLKVGGRVKAYLLDGEAELTVEDIKK